LLGSLRLPGGAYQGELRFVRESMIGHIRKWPFASFRCCAVTASLSDQSGRQMPGNIDGLGRK
jgi:hypothetical protein